MISRGVFLYVSFPTYQCIFTAQNPWLVSSSLENWADSHSPSCLQSWLGLSKDKILHLPSTEFSRPSLICNYHTVFHCVPSGLTLFSSLINTASTHKPTFSSPKVMRRLNGLRNSIEYIRTYPYNFDWIISCRYCVCLKQVLSKFILIIKVSKSPYHQDKWHPQLMWSYKVCLDACQVRCVSWQT